MFGYSVQLLHRRQEGRVRSGRYLINKKDFNIIGLVVLNGLNGEQTGHLREVFAEIAKNLIFAESYWHVQDFGVFMMEGEIFYPKVKVKTTVLCVTVCLRLRF